MSLVQTAAAAAPRPRPVPLPPPSRIERSTSASLLSADRIARPNAQPSPGAPNLDPPGADAGLPILVAAGVLAAGAVALLPPLDLAAAAAAQPAAPVFGRGATFVQTTLREAATRYREAAADVVKLNIRDPHALGAALGTQGWRATEEVVRGGVTGAALAGGAWVAGRVGSAAASVFTGEPAHETGR